MISILKLRSLFKNKINCENISEKTIEESNIISYYLPNFILHNYLDTSIKDRYLIVLTGTALGDYAGSDMEGYTRFENFTKKDKKLYSKYGACTDDTILTCATLETILTGNDFSNIYRKYVRKYPNPHGGYGLHFVEWGNKDSMGPYNSCGNGSAMRVSPCGCLNQIEDVINIAYQSACVTHNHPEGIKGAIVTAVCIWLAFHGASKEDILNYGIKYYPREEYPYSPELSYEQLLKIFPLKTSPALCQLSVPLAIRCFYESENYEDCIRKAIKFGYDTDTQAAIAGSIAAAFYQEFSDESQNVFADIKNETFIKENLLLLNE